MNNLKKLGLSALAGSLVAVSAQAGEIAVSGSANITYKTGTANTSSRSLGTDKDVAFTGSGELDNGWSFTVSTLNRCLLSIIFIYFTNCRFNGNIDFWYRYRWSIICMMKKFRKFTNKLQMHNKTQRTSLVTHLTLTT